MQADRHSEKWPGGELVAGVVESVKATYNKTQQTKAIISAVPFVLNKLLGKLQPSKPQTF